MYILDSIILYTKKTELHLCMRMKNYGILACVSTPGSPETFLDLLCRVIYYMYMYMYITSSERFLFM